MFQSVQVLVPIALFAMVFGIIYVGVMSDYRQRMAMIQRGMQPPMKGPQRNNTRKNGLLAIGIGVGLLLGYLAEGAIERESGRVVLPYFIAVLICSGSALLLAHYLDKKEK